MSTEEMDDWMRYIERARFLIDHEYVQEQNVEALAKKLKSVDDNIRNNSKPGVNNVTFYE